MTDEIRSNYGPRMRTLGLVMAGGQGTRLHPLTRDRAKPAVPFGGKYRMVDFVLSNLANSGIYSIYVLVQWRSQSLIEHLKDGWQFGSVMSDHFITPVPAQMRMGETWYLGTADAIFQNLNLIEDNKPDLVAVFGADHIYRMDVQQMIDFHLEHRAAVTVATLPVSLKEAGSFGVMEVDAESRVRGFDEKPDNPRPMPGATDRCLASMGNYIFAPAVLREALIEDAHTDTSHHDFGRDLIPRLIREVPVYAYNFMTNRIRGDSEVNLSYWRDVGTLDAYYEANMDLRDARPHLNLYNPYWPLRTSYYGQPPAKFVFDENGRRGQALHSIVSEGCIVSGGTVRNSVLGRSVFIHSYSQVEDSVLMDYAEVGRHARVRRAIIDKNVYVPEGDEIGYDLKRDRKRFFVTESGLVVIPKGPKRERAVL
jgi:glucose-1-phosphate adenylyltransferase